MMLNGFTVNGSGRALWVRLATATAFATAASVSATYSYQQRGTVAAQAGATATLVATKTTRATANASALALGSLVSIRHVNGGPVSATATATGVASRNLVVQAQAQAGAGATALPALVGTIGSSNATATCATNNPEAVRGQHSLGSATADATGVATGDVARYGQLAASLAGITYTRAETTLQLAGETIWRHEGFVPGATATVDAALVDDLIIRWARIGSYSQGRAESLSAHPTQGQFARSSASSLATGTVAPKRTFKVAAAGSCGATAQALAVRNIPTTAAQGTATASAWNVVKQRYVVTATATAGVVATLAEVDIKRAARAQASADVLGSATPADLYYATSIATLGCASLPLWVSQDHAASVMTGTLAGAELLEAHWSYQHRATAAAIAEAFAEVAVRGDQPAVASASMGAVGQALPSVERLATSTAPGVASGSATPADQVYADVVASAAVTGWSVGQLTHWESLYATVGTIGSATFADQYYAALLATATATGSVTFAGQHYADLLATASVTGRCFGTSLANTPAIADHILQVAADPRVIWVPFEDRRLRVIG